MRTLTFAGVAASVFLSTAFVLSAGAQCPDFTASGSATPTCNEVITYGSGGSFTVAAAANGLTTYDGSDDALVGFVNASSVAVSSITLDGQGVGIFGFDGDGIDTYGAPGNSMDNSGYGGPDTYFTNLSSDLTMGTVNFINPIGPGGSTYFSLEEAFDPTLPPVVTSPVTGPGGSSVTPEPGSLMLFGTGALGVVGVMRRRLFQS